MIDSQTVEKIVETSQAHILDVVGEFVTLKRRGVNYLGCCPFHQEKTPSFIVSPVKGIYKCFGCGKAGNAVSFIREHEQLDFIESIRYLGRKFRIHIEEKEQSPEQIAIKNDRESMLVAVSYAQKYFTQSLLETDEGKSVGLSYFRSRGFRDDIIHKFELGYSPEQRDAFTKTATASGYKLEYLEKSGLTIVNENYTGDRFRGRVMFPIHNLAGRVIAFGGRVLKTDAKTAKYVNSPESEIYHKSNILYGIYHAKQEIAKQDRCILVEGYTDVISMFQAGITNVVASSGTALTVGQINLIERFTKNITIIYDGDAAGIKASVRGIDLVLEQGMNVKVLLLPDGDDPDSFARKHSTEELTAYIAKNETDFIRFKIGLLLEESKNDPIKKAQLITDIVNTISVIPDSIVRTVYIKECAALMEMPEAVLYTHLNRVHQNRVDQSKQNSQQNYNNASPQQPALPNVPLEKGISTPSKNPLEREERELLRFLILYGERLITNKPEDGTVGDFIISHIKADELFSSDPVYSRIINLYDQNMRFPDFVPLKFFTQHNELEVNSLAVSVTTQSHTLSELHHKRGKVTDESELLDILVPRVLLELQGASLKLLLKEVNEEIKTVQPALFTRMTMFETSPTEELREEINGLKARMDELLSEYSIRISIQSQIAKRLGERIILK